MDASRLVLPVTNRLMWRRGRLALRKSGGSGRLILKTCIHAGPQLVLLRVYKNPWGVRTSAYLPSTSETFEFKVTSRECSEMLGDCSWSQRSTWLERLKGRLFYRRRQRGGRAEIVLNRRLYAEARKVSDTYMQLEMLVLSDGWFRVRAYVPRTSTCYDLNLDDDQIHILAAQTLIRKDGLELWPQSTVEGRSRVIQAVMSLLRVDAESSCLVAGDPVIASCEPHTTDDFEAAGDFILSERSRTDDPGAKHVEKDDTARLKSSSASSNDAKILAKSTSKLDESPTTTTAPPSKLGMLKSTALRRGRLLCTLVLRKGTGFNIFTASAYDDGYDDGRGMLRLVLYDPSLSTGASVELNRYECELIVGVRTDLLCEDRRKDMASFILRKRIDIGRVDPDHSYEDYPPRIGRHTSDGMFVIKVSSSREYTSDRVTPLRPSRTPLQKIQASVPLIRKSHPSGATRK
eukprot:g2892.t1